MRKSVMREGAARAAIYAITGVAALALALLWADARAFAAQQGGAGPPPTWEEGAGNVSLPEAETYAKTPKAGGYGPPRAGGAAAPPVPEGPQQEQLRPAAADPEEAGPVPSAADPAEMPDAEALRAEARRVSALDVGFPQTFSLVPAGEFHATAYCCEVYPHICGGNGITASGTVPTPGLTAAADWDVIPVGTWIFIEDVGMRRVEDSGSAIQEARLDIAVDTHANALVWRGFGTHRVWILE